jgi:NAD-dependent SIR2 family protein deacetylase
VVEGDGLALTGRIRPRCGQVQSERPPFAKGEVMTSLPDSPPCNELDEFLERHPRLFVLTGAGCSTESGIPDYRDADGAWKRKPPVTFQAFMTEPQVRHRYWARSFIGWRWFGTARPNGAHDALARLEARGRIEKLVTQNVDRLHQAAGSLDVVDLHGRMDQMVCMTCGARVDRAPFQLQLLERNPAWAHLDADAAPDGDADLEGHDFSAFNVPGCEHCGGLLKPDVVFFGEKVPAERVTGAMAALERADAMLVVGSSLMVYSGFRFALAAQQLGKPIAAINLGRTRADDLLTLKVARSCAEALAAL